MPISTLSKGYKKPTNPTTGDAWFPAMEENIQRVNDHTHNGSDGALIAVTTQDVLSANWGSDLGGGFYRQLMTLPAGFQFDQTRIEVRTSGGEVVYPKIERVSATTFYVYSNDNTVSMKAFYG